MTSAEAMKKRRCVRSPKAKILECSRNRPTRERTVIVSESPWTPGRRQQIPRTIRSHDPRLRDRLQEVLDLSMADDTLAWALDGDGTWHKVPTTTGVNAQARLQELAFERARRRPAGHPVSVTGA